MRKCRGFTLIELLIVVAIIGILAAIAVPNFLNAQIRAKVARVVSDLRAVTQAMEMYRLDTNSYIPESEHNIWQYPDQQRRPDAGLFFLLEPVSYIGAVPTDPFESKYEPNSSGDIDYYEVAVAPAQPEPVKKLYNINSRGPDNDEDMGARSNLQFGAAVRTYDPSNGLASDGDIYRWGGDAGIMRGPINVDGTIYNNTLPPNPTF